MAQLMTVEAQPETAPSIRIRMADIESKFHRMLEVDRNSAEFAELWAAVDEYLTIALAKRDGAAA